MSNFQKAVNKIVKTCKTDNTSKIKNTLHNTKTIPTESYWETDIEIIENCGNTPKFIDVFIYPLVKRKINILMDKFDHMEWLAYFIGEKINGFYHLKDIVIPVQDVTSVSVFNIQDPGVPKIGVIHSHHDMGNKFSHTDDEYINQNNDISLCVSKSGIQGHVRLQTFCGKYVLVEANLIDFVEDFDDKDFINEFITNINIKKIEYTPNISNIRINDSNDIEFVNLIDTIDKYQERISFDVLHDSVYTKEYLHLLNILKTLRNIDDPRVEQEYITYVNLFYDDISDNEKDFTKEGIELVDEIDVDTEGLTEQELKHADTLIETLEDIISFEKDNFNNFDNLNN